MKVTSPGIIAACLRASILPHYDLPSRPGSKLTVNQDLRNHGESGHHSRHDYMEMALDVEAFIQSHHLQRPTLIGHSMYYSHPPHTIEFTFANQNLVVIGDQKQR